MLLVSSNTIYLSASVTICTFFDHQVFSNKIISWLAFKQFSEIVKPLIFERLIVICHVTMLCLNLQSVTSRAPIRVLFWYLTVNEYRQWESRHQMLLVWSCRPLPPSSTPVRIFRASHTHPPCWHPDMSILGTIPPFKILWTSNKLLHASHNHRPQMDKSVLL